MAQKQFFYYQTFSNEGFLETKKDFLFINNLAKIKRYDIQTAELIF